MLLTTTNVEDTPEKRHESVHIKDVVHPQTLTNHTYRPSLNLQNKRPKAKKYANKKAAKHKAMSRCGMRHRWRLWGHETWSWAL